VAGRKGKKYARPDLVDALVDKRIALPDAYEADADGTLEALLGKHAPVEAAVDLTPLLDEWVTSTSRNLGRGGQAEVYREQLLRLYPSKPLTLAMFTRKEVWARLDALDVDAPTKNRYRSAASSLAKFLVKRELLETQLRARHRRLRRERSAPRVLRARRREEADRRASPQPYAGDRGVRARLLRRVGRDRPRSSATSSSRADPITAHVRGTKRRGGPRRAARARARVGARLHPAAARREAADGAHVRRRTGVAAIDVQRDTANLKIVAVGEDEFGPHSIHDWRTRRTPSRCCDGATTSRSPPTIWATKTRRSCGRITAGSSRRSTTTQKQKSAANPLPLWRPLQSKTSSEAA
jgi:hypothetical protein